MSSGWQVLDAPVCRPSLGQTNPKQTTPHGWRPSQEAVNKLHFSAHTGEDFPLACKFFVLFLFSQEMGRWVSLMVFVAPANKNKNLFAIYLQLTLFRRY